MTRWPWLNKALEAAPGPPVPASYHCSVTQRAYRFYLLGFAVVAAAGSVLDVMEVDAAQYASQAREMLAQENWLKLYWNGNDYLDKPPLLFWLSALSFKVFGVSNWSYKLPSILFAFLGVHSTYRFALLHHAPETARRAAVLFGSSAGFMLMSSDIRCDTILTASVITAVWAGTAFVEHRRWWQLLLLAAAVSSGMLVKGPIGAVAPGLAIGGHIALTGKWRALLDARWLLLPVLVGLALVPMCIGLYDQFGMHGIRFYFWEQSFGRITGENRWVDDSTKLFFLHELPWQVAPWTLFVLLGTMRAAADAVRRRPLPEYASLAGALLVFAALSFSRFKLPHYLYVTLPLFAVLGARAWPFCAHKGFRLAHLAVLALVSSLALILAAWSFAHPAWPVAAGLFGLAAWRMAKRWHADAGAALFDGTVTVWLVAALTVNALVYPRLLQHQANAQVGKWIAQEALRPDQFHNIALGGPAMDFYGGYPIRWLPDVEAAMPFVAAGQVFYMDDARYREWVDKAPPAREVVEIEDYIVQLLTIEFLNPNTREGVLEKRYLVKY